LPFSHASNYLRGFFHRKTLPLRRARVCTPSSAMGLIPDIAALYFAKREDGDSLWSRPSHPWTGNPQQRPLPLARKGPTYHQARGVLENAGQPDNKTVTLPLRVGMGLISARDPRSSLPRARGRKMIVSPQTSDSPIFFFRGPSGSHYSSERAVRLPAAPVINPARADLPFGWSPLPDAQTVIIGVLC